MIYTISLVLYYCILFLRKELFRYPHIGDISFYWYHFCNLVFHPPFSITALIRSDDIFFLSSFLTFYLSRWTGRIFRLSSILSITSSSITVHFSLLRSSSSGSFLSPEISLDLFLLQQLFGWFPPFSWWWHVWTGMLPSSHWHWLCLCLRLPYYESLKQQTGNAPASTEKFSKHDYSTHSKYLFFPRNISCKRNFLECPIISSFQLHNEIWFEYFIGLRWGDHRWSELWNTRLEPQI